jgi:hypothetical protein
VANVVWLGTTLRHENDSRVSNSQQRGIADSKTLLSYIYVYDYFNLSVGDICCSRAIYHHRPLGMDPERVQGLPQSEIPPSHSLDQDTSGTQPDPFNPSHSNVPRTTAQIDTSNSSPYAGNAPTDSPSSEKLGVSEISSLQHINDYFAQRIQSPLPARLPESNSGKRETGITNERFSNPVGHIRSGIDWIVPTEEGVSNHLNTLNLFTY